MRKQTVNILDDWIYASSQTEWVKNEEKELKTVINNETISYLYVSYIYQGKNWECPVCKVDDDHCRHFHCMICQGLYSKDQV